MSGSRTQRSIIAVLAIAALTTLSAPTHAATVDATDPILGVSGPSVIVEGTSFAFNGNTVTIADSGNNRAATIKEPPPNQDHYFGANPGNLDTAVYRYAEVFYSLDSDFAGSNHQLRLQTTAQPASFVTFNNSAAIPSTAGSHSYVIDLGDGTTDLNNSGYSGDLTYFRWDWWNDSGNDGKSFTLDRIVLAPELANEPDGADTIILSDNFNTSGNYNSDLNTRQTGTLATKTYSGTGSIWNGQLTTTQGGPLVNSADLTTSLTDPTIAGFRVSLDIAITSTGNNWISPYLNTHTGRGDSQMGLLIFANGNVAAYGTNQGGGNNQEGVLTQTVLDNLLGSWDVSALNNYELVATPSTGTYDLYINGTQVLTGINYSFDLIGPLEFQNVNISGGEGLYDNLVISTFAVPEPASLASGLLGLTLLAARRRR
jgi:hypothetical protein